MRGPKKPSLNLSGAKPPQALADVYYDLRDRRLLPLVALALVAIVAVPILLGNDEEAVELPPPAAAAETLEALAKNSSELTVVEAKPGLRDYRKRLKGTPTNPFKQRYTGPSGLEKAQLGDGEGGEGGGSGDAGGDTTVTVEGEGDKVTVTETPKPGGAKPGAAPPAARPGLTFYNWAINVRIVKKGGKEAAGGGSSSEPIVKKKVLPQTALPGPKAPVLTYMGAARQGKKLTGKALMIVSDEVRSVAGDARCLSGEGVCQLLEVEPGFPVVLTYGENEVRYVVNVLRLGLVVTGRSKAPGHG